jgi:sugar phosphate isomerase/epimerase
VTVLGTPYRLGATSYVWSADIVSNVRQLGPLVDDVEFVLFEVDGHSNLPDASARAELELLAQLHELTYTIHLPADLGLAHLISLELARRVIACTRELAPLAYVLHLDGRPVEADPDPGTLGGWQDDALRILEEVAKMAGGAAQLCVENLENYSPEHFLPLLDLLPVGLCVDVGHLWLTGRDPVAFLEEHLARTRVVHLHGVAEYDHMSLAHRDAKPVEPVLNLLSETSFEGVVTLEVFGQEDFFSSRDLVVEVVNGRKRT